MKKRRIGQRCALHTSFILHPSSFSLREDGLSLMPGVVRIVVGTTSDPGAGWFRKSVTRGVALGSRKSADLHLGPRAGHGEQGFAHALPAARHRREESVEQ